MGMWKLYYATDGTVATMVSTLRNRVIPYCTIVFAYISLISLTSYTISMKISH